MENIKPTSIRIETELKTELEKIAKIERRSLNNLIGIALADYVRRYNHQHGTGPK